MSGLALSVVIPAYNNWWLTKRCLLAVEKLRTSSQISFETIVVDNASTDETQSGMREFGWAVYKREEVNTNFSGAGNIGARLAQAPLVLFLNNDAMPVGDAFAPLVAAFADERVAIAGGCVLFEDGPVQATGLVVMSNGGWWTSYRNLPSDLPEVQRARDVIGVNGAAMVVDKAWFHSVGGFDEGYINGSEDVDLFMRATQSGRTLRYVPGAVFHHYESAAPNRYDYDEQNARRFSQRWHAEMRGLPRIERGEISAIAIQCDAIGQQNLAFRYALEDLLVGLRQFGHPIVRGKIKPWALLDRRFRESATLAWFCDERNVAQRPPTVTVTSAGALAQFRTFGVEDISVPWLPCALPEAKDRCAIFYDEGRSTARTVAVVKGVSAVPQLRALGASFGMTLEIIEVDDVLDLSKERRPVDLAILPGLTDPCGYGNLALAHAGVPVVMADTGSVRNVYSEDTAVIVLPENLCARALEVLERTEILRSNANRMKADAARRFSVRRAAMRFTDIARVARNGFERQIG